MILPRFNYLLHFTLRFFLFVTEENGKFAELPKNFFLRKREREKKNERGREKDRDYSNKHQRRFRLIIDMKSSRDDTCVCFITLFSYKYFVETARRLFFIFWRAARLSRGSRHPLIRAPSVEQAGEWTAPRVIVSLETRIWELWRDIERNHSLIIDVRPATLN